MDPRVSGSSGEVDDDHQAVCSKAGSAQPTCWAMDSLRLGEDFDWDVVQNRILPTNWIWRAGVAAIVIDPNWGVFTKRSGVP
jgi:hypothetical protein